ncbi:hypothetical protein P8A18_23750 [Streptomyces castrisilvae]|uniref:Uncharacterized protein n=1 Tax=Streptomyces castrisilvae TaxID=3033811 RepID=A0ABY9HQG4_9ACTN|nr:hypothetical protein [Streptomyces sp. Mut1]WLQ36253.1 hypothetical protein P8A18_23750 [Streptomyces sp. Mut1]
MPAAVVSRGAARAISTDADVTTPAAAVEFVAPPGSGNPLAPAPPGATG